MRCVTWDECVYDPGTEADAVRTQTARANVAMPVLSALCLRRRLSVCGDDGRTYPNECAAQCVNVEVIT